MVFVKATRNEVIGKCIEGIKVEVSGEILKTVLVCSGFVRFGAQCLFGVVVWLHLVQWCQALEDVLGILLRR